MLRCTKTDILAFLSFMVWGGFILACCGKEEKNALSIDRHGWRLPANNEVIRFSGHSTTLNRSVPFYERYKTEGAIAIEIYTRAIS